MENLAKQIITWLRNECLPLLIIGSLMTISLAFTYYFITGTIILLLGGHHVFAYIIWSFLTISLLYFSALFLTQMWEDRTIEIFDKIKPTIVYVSLVAVITYVAINNRHIITLSIIYLFVTIGSITGHSLNDMKQLDK